MMVTSLVLAKINAPHREQLDAAALAHCLLDVVAAKAKPGHMSSFFGEVEPDLQFEFAHLFNITDAQLVSAAKAFAKYSGKFYPLAA